MISATPAIPATQTRTRLRFISPPRRFCPKQRTRVRFHQSFTHRSPNQRQPAGMIGGLKVTEALGADRVGENRLLNRELSSLEFYARVLELAEDANVPLLERVRFLSIFSAHLDEFFMVRVGGLRGQEDAGISRRSPDGRTPTEILGEIRERALDLTSRQARVWRRDLRTALAEEGID